MKKTIHGGDIYRHPDMIDFSSNCNPFGPPQRVQDAICRAVGSDRTLSRIYSAAGCAMRCLQSCMFRAHGFSLETVRQK